MSPIVMYSKLLLPLMLSILWTHFLLNNLPAKRYGCGVARQAGTHLGSLKFFTIFSALLLILLLCRQASLHLMDLLPPPG